MNYNKYHLPWVVKTYDFLPTYSTVNELIPESFLDDPLLDEKAIISDHPLRRVTPSKEYLEFMAYCANKHPMLVETLQEILDMLDDPSSLPDLIWVRAKIEKTLQEVKKGNKK